MNPTSLPANHTFESNAAAMRHALALAASAEGHVEPNPMVGAVLVDDSRRLIADGFHAVYGGPHAEANALKKAGDSARGQTLFVTLEPCAHTGKQPPCADTVIAAGIKRVICAMGDPFPEVAGKGFEKLRAAGIEVEVGLLENEARRLNAPFLKRITTGQPYVIAKYAMTLDGKMATTTGHSMWISSPESRKIVHQIRGRVDAIIVGLGTAAADNPKLTVRPPGPRTPIRVVLDSRAQLSLETDLVKTAREVPTHLFHTVDASADSVKALVHAGVETHSVTADECGRPDVSETLQRLGQMEITNVLLEGGAAVLGSFHAAEAIDEYRVFVAPKTIGDGKSPLSSGISGLPIIPEQPNVVFESIQKVGVDIAITARVVH